MNFLMHVLLWVTFVIYSVAKTRSIYISLRMFLGISLFGWHRKYSHHLLNGISGLGYIFWGLKIKSGQFNTRSSVNLTFLDYIWPFHIFIQMYGLYCICTPQSKKKISQCQCMMNSLSTWILDNVAPVTMNFHD